MKKLKILSALFVLFAVPKLYAEGQRAELKLLPFETDGCTMFVDGTQAKPGLWKHCCVEHDLRYWFGGAEADMDKADLKLKSCVESVAGSSWANLIYTGVRAGHYSPIKNKYQWGWGWKEKRQKVPLNNEETAYVINELRNMVMDEISIEDFIKFYFP